MGNLGHRGESIKQKSKEKNTTSRECSSGGLSNVVEKRTNDEGLDDVGTHVDGLVGHVSLETLETSLGEESHLHGKGDEVGRLLSLSLHLILGQRVLHVLECLLGVMGTHIVVVLGLDHSELGEASQYFSNSSAVVGTLPTISG